MDKKKLLSGILARDRESMVAFLRDIIALPSPSGGEKEVAARTVQEMQRCGFEKALSPHAQSAWSPFRHSIPSPSGAEY